MVEHAVLHLGLLVAAFQLAPQVGLRHFAIDVVPWQHFVAALPAVREEVQVHAVCLLHLVERELPAPQVEVLGPPVEALAQLVGV